ncbi:GPO family capsid scaffolding protein [Aliivibrio fischeri]|uniref:Phage capsid protein n=1 Tax=Aliivibrio fischeri TaxID=668 RepID=A0A510UIP6_ALIFS|nr:GPO family capsid scaffolding protein [Aliivibrio fischeri]GEK13231.1 hypothetical protein AFI02nite_12670 [Aliivibrio fischeri]
MSLQSGFINIGTSGKTVDDRVIEPSWLEEAAETYDPKFYTAVIDLNHWSPIWAGSYGKVLAVEKAKNESGETVLRANIEPNEALIEMSKKEVLFTSMSLMPDFRGSGKHYLHALAVTPKPASVGTDQLQFSSENNDEKIVRTDFVKVELDFTSKTESTLNEKKLFNSLKEFFKTNNPADEQENEMSKELEQKVDSIAEKLNNFLESNDKNNTAEVKLSAAEKLLSDNGYSVKKAATSDDLNAAQELLKAQGFSIKKEASAEELKAAQELLKAQGFSVSTPSDDTDKDEEVETGPKVSITRKEFEVLKEKFADAKVTEFNFTPPTDHIGNDGDTQYL